MSNNPKFFLGTDSAPHLVGRKECAAGCAGVFTAPVAIALLAQLFEQESDFITLENFVSFHGKQFYREQDPLGVPDKIKLVRKPWTVPNFYDGVVPFFAGETLGWQVQT